MTTIELEKLPRKDWLTENTYTGFDGKGYSSPEALKAANELFVEKFYALSRRNSDVKFPVTRMEDKKNLVTRI